METIYRTGENLGLKDRRGRLCGFVVTTGHFGDDRGFYYAIQPTRDGKPYQAEKRTCRFATGTERDTAAAHAIVRTLAALKARWGAEAQL
jgi:hypothetical protein